LILFNFSYPVVALFFQVISFYFRIILFFLLTNFSFIWALMMSEMTKTLRNYWASYRSDVDVLCVIRQCYVCRNWCVRSVEIDNKQL